MSFTIVTGLIDIKRGEWNSYFRRSFENYFSSMKQGVLRYDHPMVIFIQEEYYDQVARLRKDFPNTRIIPTSLEKCRLFPKRDEFKKIQESSQYKEMIKPEHRDNPEHWCPEYNIVTLQKAYWMRDLLIENPFKTDYFVWIDGGYGKGKLDLAIPSKLDISTITNSISNEKIFFQVIGDYPRDEHKFPTGIDPVRYFKANDTFVSGGFYIAGKNSLHLFEKYLSSISYCYQQKIIDDDQYYWYLVINAFGPHFGLYLLKDWKEVFDFPKSLSSPIPEDSGRKLSPEVVQEFKNVYKPKIAVLITGNVRCWKQVNKTWMKKYDCFAVAYKKKYMYHPFILEKLHHLPDQDIDPEKDLEQDDIKFKKIIVLPQERDEQIEQKMHPKMRENFHAYYQYQTSLEAFRLIPELNNYDLVIRTRFDIDAPLSFMEKYEELLETFEPTLLLNSMGNNFAYNFTFNQTMSCDQLIRDVSSMVLDPPLPSFIMINPSIPLSDTVFVGSPNTVKDFFSFAIENYFNPCNSKAWENPPHGIVGEFIKLKKIPAQLVNFGAILRPPLYDPIIVNHPVRKNPLKIALLISGHVRGDLILLPPQQWLTKHNIDIFYSGWLEKDFLYAIRDLDRLTKLTKIENFFTFDHEKIMTRIVDENQSDDYLRYPGICNKKTFGNACSMWYRFEQGLNMIRAQDKNYDLIIRWRPDFELEENIPIDDEWLYQSVDKRCLMMPEWHGKFEHINRKMMDQLFWGPAEWMQKLCLYSSRKEHFEQSEFAHTGEGMLARMIEKEKIPIERFPVHYGLRRNDRVEKIV